MRLHRTRHIGPELLSRVRVIEISTDRYQEYNLEDTASMRIRELIPPSSEQSSLPHARRAQFDIEAPLFTFLRRRHPICDHFARLPT